MGAKWRSTYLLAGIAAALAIAVILLLFFSKWNGEPQRTTSLSAWVADWDLNSGMQDLRQLAGALQSVQVFAVYYDERDSLLYTEEMAHLMEQVRELVVEPSRSPQSTSPSSSAASVPTSSTPQLYVTVVNDIWHADGTAVQKDSDLISRIVQAKPEVRSAHHRELADAVERFGFAGLEVDYERVKEEDWPAFLVWVQELHEVLQERGKKLRIVLEPRAPLTGQKLPEGPDYVMMAYNLHGYHNGPGPKANEALLRRLAASMNSAVQGEPIIALATGGFDWEDGAGTVRAVTEQEAVRLAEEHQVTPRRDPSSGALYFTYIDADIDADTANRLHTVWYADAETLRQWMDILREEGVERIALWRLGGLTPSSLHFIHERAAAEQ